MTNPPYGERVGDARALVGLYRDFGARLREHAPGYRLGLLTGGEHGGEPLADALDLPELERRPLLNGALKCVLLSGEIAGTPGPDAPAAR